jgi:hypothetical protein
MHGALLWRKATNSPSRAQNVQKLADVVVALRWMAHRKAAVERVAVSPPNSLSAHVARLDEVTHDSLCRSLCDAHRLGDVAKPRVWAPLEAEENLSMVREKVPALYFKT